MHTVFNSYYILYLGVGVFILMYLFFFQSLFFLVFSLFMCYNFFRSKMFLSLIIKLFFNFLFVWNIYIFFIVYEFLIFPLLIWTLVSCSMNFILTRSFIFLFFLSYILTFFFFLSFLLFSISLVQYNFIFFLLFSLSFIFKAPLFPFFNWLIFLHVYASTGISVFLASFYLKMWALFFLYFYFYLNYNLILYFGILTCFLVLLFISFEINFKRIIAFGSIFHCAISLMFIYFWYVIQFQSLILYFFIIHFIHAFCSGLFFYYFGILYEFCLIKTWVAFTTFSKFWNEFIFFAFLLSMVYFSFPLFFTFFSRNCNPNKHTKHFLPLFVFSSYFD